MKVFVHIGTEKTGTTSIQDFFDLNRQKLHDLGIAYLRSIGHTNNRKLATCCIGLDRKDDAIAALGIEEKEKRKKWQSRILRELRAEVNNLPSNIQTIVISSEHFHSRLVSVQELEFLRQILMTIADEIKIIVYLRPQVEMAISLYSTALKVGQYNSNILPKVNPEQSIYYNYEKLLILWSKVFKAENLIVRLFEQKEMFNGNVIEDLLTNVLAVRYQYGDLIHIHKKNESITPVGQKILNSINKHFVDKKDIRVKLRKYIEVNYAGKGLYPPKEKYLAFQSKFQNSNSQVAQMWLGKDTLFEINYPDQKNSDSKLYSEESVDSLIGFFKTLL